MNLKKLGWISSFGILLQGCSSIENFGSDTMAQYATVQDLIIQKKINDPDGSAKEYVYAWGAKNKEAEPHSLYPRKYLSNYCHAKAGRFSVLHKSTLNLVKDAKTRSALAANRNVAQGIGAYQCEQQNGQRWIVSIEPTAELKSSYYANARVVRLQTEIMSADQAKRFYQNRNAVSPAVKKPAAAVKSPAVKAPVIKEVEEKKEILAAVEPIKPPAQVADTPQQQQMKYYVAARRDLAKGQNQTTACNNAQRAYNYGKLHGANASNAYAESGVLLARCLTSVPAYSRQVPNAKNKAVGILQNLSKNYNHAGAKHMLQQIK